MAQTESDYRVHSLVVLPNREHIFLGIRAIPKRFAAKFAPLSFRFRSCLVNGKRGRLRFAGSTNLSPASPKGEGLKYSANADLQANIGLLVLGTALISSVLRLPHAPVLANFGHAHIAAIQQAPS